jgi:hypothetical protein
MDGDGKIFAFASNLGRVFALMQNSNEAGIYHSKPIDSKLFAQWGRIHVEGDGTWTIRTRSGNTSDPDKSWNPWVDLKDDKIQSSDSRYLQFELAIKSGFVKSVRIFYLPQNQPPVILILQILDPGLGFTKLNPPESIPTPQTVETLLRLVREDKIKQSKKTSFQPKFEQGLRTAIWEASDPNDDDLEYKLWIKKDSDSKWTLLKDKLDEPLFSWDTTSWPEGRYRVKLVVSDEKDNPAGQELTAEQESQSFVIDHTPPVITVKEQTANHVRFSVADATSLLDEVSASKDGEDYKQLLPLQGPLDDKQAEFECTREHSKNLFLKAVDEAGNVAGIVIKADQ